jgi:hypothetical protein
MIVVMLDNAIPPVPVFVLTRAHAIAMTKSMPILMDTINAMIATTRMVLFSQAHWSGAIAKMTTAMARLMKVLIWIRTAIISVQTTRDALIAMITIRPFILERLKIVRRQMMTTAMGLSTKDAFIVIPLITIMMAPVNAQAIVTTTIMPFIPMPMSYVTVKTMIATKIPLKIVTCPNVVIGPPKKLIFAKTN